MNGEQTMESIAFRDIRVGADGQVWCWMPGRGQVIVASSDKVHELDVTGAPYWWKWLCFRSKTIADQMGKWTDRRARVESIKKQAPECRPAERHAGQDGIGDGTELTGDAQTLDSAETHE